MLAVIGGSGFYGLEAEDHEPHPTANSYGRSSGELTSATVGGRRVLFLPRHAADHSVAPHHINFRANIEALRLAGAKRILAVCTVGGIEPSLVPGSLVVPHQLIDYTWGREHTFTEPGGEVRHVDFTDPYSPSWRAEVCATMSGMGIEFVDGGVYAAVQGPRFETAAEVRRLRADGCTVVGMTGMPEAALAREAGLEYAVICPVGNLAAGMAPVELRFDDVIAATADRNRLVHEIVEKLPDEG